MDNQLWTDEEILNAIRGVDTNKCNQAFRNLFYDEKLQRSVNKKIRSIGGDEADFVEFFHLALVRFDEAVRNNVYNEKFSSIRTYIKGVAVKMFITRKRSNNSLANRHENAAIFYDSTAVSINAEDEMIFRQQAELLEKIIGGLGGKCRELLKLSSLNYSNAEIANKLMYKTANAAKSAVYDCRGKLRAFLNDNPALKAQLIGL